MTDKVETCEDALTSLLHSLVGFSIVGVVVDFDKETGEKFYGLRITKRIQNAIEPPLFYNYAVWFLSDTEGNGAGGFQIQNLG